MSSRQRFRLTLWACLLCAAPVCGLSLSQSAFAAAASSPGRVWAIAGTGRAQPAPLPLCRDGIHCGVGDLATEATLGSSRYAGTVIHLDAEGRLYLNQRGSDTDSPVVRVALNGRIDEIVGLPLTPDNIAIGLKGEIYYTNADRDDDQTVWRWDPQTHRSTRFAGRQHIGAADVGLCGENGDPIPVCALDQGIPAARALLHTVDGLAVDARGRLLIADGGAFAVRRVERNLTITTVAGDGKACETECTRPGLPAAQTSVFEPRFVASGADGSTWFTVGTWLYRVTRSGAIRRVWTPTTNHPISPPAIDRNGSAIIGYWPAGANARLVRVTPGGHVTRILGGGAGCNPGAAALTCGDGSIVSSAKVAHQVVSVGIAPNGDIYFADEGAEVRYIPVRGMSPARLAVSGSAPSRVSRGRPLRIAIRADAASMISVIVIGRGRADIASGSARTAGSIAWHGSADGRLLPPGNYTLEIVATDKRGRRTSRVLPVQITKD